MGYLFLAVALLAGTTKGFFGKKTSNHTAILRDAVLASTIRIVLCAVIGFGLIALTEDIRGLAPSWDLLWVSALSGVSTAIFVVSWLVCVKKSAYMMLDIFLMLGVLIPLLASNLFLGEAIKLTQWLGIAVLFVAVILMCSYNNSIKAKLTPAAFLLLLICGVASGIADFSQKLFVKTTVGFSATVFNFYTYLFAALVLAVAFWLTPKPAADAPKADFKKIFGFIFVMSVCLFLNSFFKTLAANHLDAVLLYPLNQGCALILSALMASALLKEKLTVKAVLGIATAFAGLLIINLL